MSAPLTFDDPRVKRVTREMKLYDRRPDALIQILHIVQEIFGYLPEMVLRLVAKELRVPASRVYGVSTFYHYFSLKARGDHQCLVCMGTACYVKGAGKILDQLQKAFGVRPGEVTPDGKLGLAQARCLGACGLAPAVVYDEEILARVDPAKIAATVQEKLRGS
ncbi:MAG: NAD(P)H-dependent oxidoreductase subunit E [Elusimicrobia bacterium]|nr:NAD(P)H-dependent oxidoreductase subunit E [Elusimicrobiota bacterium]